MSKGVGSKKVLLVSGNATKVLRCIDLLCVPKNLPLFLSLIIGLLALPRAISDDRYRNVYNEV